MKLVRYGDKGSEKPGLIHGETLRDLSAHISDLSGASLLPETMERLRGLDPDTLPVVDGTPRIGACVDGVGKFMCIGLNYSDHAAELNLDVPAEPVLFLKANSAITGPNDGIELPRGSVKTDWEVELAIVIGKPGRYISEADALSHVAGYCIANDVTERSFQNERAGQWTKGKSPDTFGPLGPWLVTPDEVPDTGNLGIWLTVNGETMQKGSTKTMIFGVAFVVSYLSQFFTLNTGDVISTGTPPGVGAGKTPPRFLKQGDIVQLGIDGLGEQRQVVMAEGGVS